MEQMRLCYAGLLKRRDRRLDLRNFMTGATPYEDLTEAVAAFLGGETSEVRQLIGHLMLGPETGRSIWRAETPPGRPRSGQAATPAFFRRMGLTSIRSSSC
jgi:hypothetical protein